MKTVTTSIINGKLIHNGKGTDTGASINIFTVLDENGDPKTTMETIDFQM
jgi:hypothetical protein